MFDTHTKTDVDLRLQAARELAEMFANIEKLFGRMRAILADIVMDELETLADDPKPDQDSDVIKYQYRCPECKTIRELTKQQQYESIECYGIHSLTHRPFKMERIHDSGADDPADDPPVDSLSDSYPQEGP